MEIFVVVRGALEEMGGFMAVDVEAAFDSKQKAEEYLRGKQTVWTEAVNNCSCYCERAVHIVRLE